MVKSDAEPVKAEAAHAAVVAAMPILESEILSVR
jgi:hypothetical protein